uniref:Uncharacterized protein n=1 Tax=Aegilops tauschii subsp. strangulata TaxID=200361 RepID=A0A453F716_AEGTS
MPRTRCETTASGHGKVPDTTCVMGNGRSATFWDGRWMDGAAPRTLAPGLYVVVWPTKRLASVQDGLHRGSWISNIKGEFTAAMIFQFCQLWVAVNHRRAVMTDSADNFRWIWTSSGGYSARTAYRTLFEGLTRIPGAERLRNSAAPLRQKFFG